MESLKSTVYQSSGVKFPEFILILLKCLQFLQAANQA